MVMTFKQTIDMAREAGDDWDSTLSTDKEFLKRFEALVRADEREACAKVCFGFEGADPLGVSLDCAAAIRARGNT
jgi:hypothetical protein